MVLDATPVYDPVVFVQYGVLGVILMMMLTGWLWPKPAVEDMKKAMEAERKLWTEELLPTLRTISADLKENTRAQRVATNELTEAIRLLEEKRPL